ncbi:hypothetical protein P170DRAFT_278490 [Aspergillus steynii IBT 23096]|uniref:Uncharacterized protein n=1 Tax=Aspergillus steynii IBT 23096 TaxID=1392250 RepID=A0A2I2FXH8_9EURO|nr:uncharacterized protein P170DRAFT_278490 [Aspergillus steynii IBT 23096]PLB45286.1 hypothetical protein P170DRAFT_278490 [Aspergillus steynii IBT 23096]
MQCSSTVHPDAEEVCWKLHLRHRRIQSVSDGPGRIRDLDPSKGSPWPGSCFLSCLWFVCFPRLIWIIWSPESVLSPPPPQDSWWVFRCGFEYGCSSWTVLAHALLPRAGPEGLKDPIHHELIINLARDAASRRFEC